MIHNMAQTLINDMTNDMAHKMTHNMTHNISSNRKGQKLIKTVGQAEQNIKGDEFAISMDSVAMDIAIKITSVRGYSKYNN